MRPSRTPVTTRGEAFKLKEVLQIAGGVAIGLVVAEVVMFVAIRYVLRRLWEFLGNDKWG